MGWKSIHSVRICSIKIGECQSGKVYTVVEHLCVSVGINKRTTLSSQISLSYISHYHNDQLNFPSYENSYCPVPSMLTFLPTS